MVRELVKFQSLKLRHNFWPNTWSILVNFMPLKSVYLACFGCSVLVRAANRVAQMCISVDSSIGLLREGLLPRLWTYCFSLQFCQLALALSVVIRWCAFLVGAGLCLVLMPASLLFAWDPFLSFYFQTLSLYLK